MECEYGLMDSKDKFDALPMEDQHLLMDWIKANVRPKKMPIFTSRSKDLRERMSEDIRNYAYDSGEFKGAMLYCGFFPLNPYEGNWRFAISRLSPVFWKKQKRQR